MSKPVIGRYMFFATLLTLATPFAHTTDWHVRPVQQGLNNGTDWNNAWSFSMIKRIVHVAWRASRWTALLAMTIIHLSLAVWSRAEVIPPDRRIDWDPGVRQTNGARGIPVRDTVHATVLLGSSAQDIQNALNNCPAGQVVQLQAGTYNINQSIRIPSNVTLRGMGMGTTILKGLSGFSGVSVINFDSGFDTEWSAPSRSLVSPSKGARHLATTAAHGWTTGDVVLIDMLEQPNGNPPIDNNGSLGNCGWCGRTSGTRPVGQWVTVTNVPTATTAEIDPPLYWSYANSPQGTEMTGLTHYAGVEDLTVDNLTSAVRDTVVVSGGINCWLSGVELKGNKRRAVWGYGALWFTMQGCRVTGGVPIGTDLTPQYDSDRAYGVFLGPHFSAALITDNIFEKLTNAISFEGAVSGNVFSYNFITDMWWRQTGGDYPRRIGPLMHGPHPFMNLLEGNWSSDRFRADEYWGTSSHFTLFRNRIKQTNRGAPYAQAWVIDIERRNWYYSLVGNVLGTAGEEDEYELYNESDSYHNGAKAIYRLGYRALGMDTNLFDPQVKATLLRHGNWVSRIDDNSAGDAIEWDSAIHDRTIPTSLYLSQKPAWFGGFPWPPYDPTVPAARDDATARIPAHARYLGQAEPPVDPPPPSGDFTPPVRSNGRPTGTLASGTTATTLSVNTNEASTCRFGAIPSQAFADMPNTFATTGGTMHSEPLTGLTNGVTYDFYVRCRDHSANQNVNPTDYRIPFTVALAGNGSSQPDAVPDAQKTVFNPSKGEEALILIANPLAGRVTATVYDRGGKETAVILDEDRPSGDVPVRWNGRNRSQEIVSSGVYLVVIKKTDGTVTKKVVVVK